MGVNLKALIGKCNSESRAALEAAAGLCLSRTHYDVEIEHYLMKLLDQNEGDFAAIVKHYGIDRSRLAAELTRSLDHLKSGNARNPALSPTLVRMFQQAWTLGSLEFNATQIRTGHTILALLSDEELNRVVRDVSRELPKINADGLKQEFFNITAASHEKDFTAAAGGDDAESAPRAAGGKTPNLDQFTIDLTERAKQGKIDPVLGRDFEIRQVVDILTRRRQNNPILVGEAGVGKTAVVEGFALRIAQGDVPEELKSSPTPIILFIDEAHTMIGAGGAAGQNDAANLLKPALARGELRTLAATTWSEYKKYFEKDPALTRRFQMIKVDEPDEKKCAMMLRGIIPALENHHQVRILDEGLEAAVKLSHRYLPDRQLPDKAVSVLDTACARLALGQNVTPGPIEDCHRVLDDVAVQMRVLERESSAGADHSERLAALASLKAKTEQRLAGLSAQWEK